VVQKLYFPYPLETHLVDHCNLKCKGCSHFSPLVEGQVFKEFKVFQKDLTRLKELFEDFFEIRLMGGEPLLHPEINDFCEFARATFPAANISIYTNGIKLLDMPEGFRETCHRHAIKIKITYYPITLNLKNIKQKAQYYGVQIKIPKMVTKFFNMMNLSGDSDPEKSYQVCKKMYQTPHLKDGKLYPCPLPAYVHYFNAYFEYDIQVSENDCIDIYGPVEPKEIIRFLDQPLQTCRWCVTRRDKTEWGITQRDISEWSGQEAGIISHNIRMLKYQAISLYQKIKKVKS